MELDGFGALPWELRSSQRVNQLLAIARTAPRDRARLCRRFDAYLRSHPTMATWLARRPRLRDTPHFARYLSEQKRPRYDRAIDALGAGTASVAQLELVRALGMEIAGSSLVVRSGLVLLSGRLRERHHLLDSRYEQFLWTTIHPVLAIERAELAHQVAGPQPPTVDVLHVERDLPGLLGRRGSHVGYDILLPRRLRTQVFATHENSRLTIREVSLSF